MMSLEPFETAEAQCAPTVRQQSVFLENRVGQLLRLTQVFQETDIRILALSIVHAVDCAICRVILDEPDNANEFIRNHGFSVAESELLVVSLPKGKRALLNIWACLLRGEVSINYTYPLLVQPTGCPAVALSPDNVDAAYRVLSDNKFEMLDETDLFDIR
jgi:hypothetical protein